MSLQPFIGPWPLFRFLNLFCTVGRTAWTGDEPVARPLPSYRTAQTQNRRTQTFMPEVGFETIIPVFERPKTVHALDRASSMVRRNAYIQYDIMLLHDQVRSPSNPILDGTIVLRGGIGKFPDCYCLGERRREWRPRSHFRKPIASVCHVTPRCDHALFLYECFFDFVFLFYVRWMAKSSNVSV
jgi:hypothetical protein